MDLIEMVAQPLTLFLNVTYAALDPVGCLTRLRLRITQFCLHEVAFEGARTETCHILRKLHAFHSFFRRRRVLRGLGGLSGLDAPADDPRGASQPRERGARLLPTRTFRGLGWVACTIVVLIAIHRPANRSRTGRPSAPPVQVLAVVSAAPSLDLIFRNISEVHFFAPCVGCKDSRHDESNRHSHPHRFEGASLPQDSFHDDPPS